VCDSAQPDAAVPEPGRLYWALLAVVAVAMVAPFVVVEYLPLVDLPNHEARLGILADYGSNETMRQLYEVDWRPIPNLAFDLVGVPLVRLGLSPVAAGRLFLCATALLYVLGGHLLAAATRGRRSWLGVVLPLVLYSSMLLLGFLSFVFGFALFLIAYALWFAGRPEPSDARVAAVAALALAAVVSHLAAFGLLSVAVAATSVADLAEGRATRRGLLRSAAAFVPSCVFLLVSLTERGSSGGTDWGSAAVKAKPVAGFFLTYGRGADALLLGAILACVVIALVAARARSVRWSVASAALALAGLYVVVPHSLATATDVDTRLVPAVVVLGLCSVRLSLPPRLAAGLAVAVVVVAVVRLGYVTHEWRQIGGAIGRQVALLDRSLPRNADVYSVFPQGASWIGRNERAYAHVASYATIDRNAHVSRTFALAAQQPLVARRPEPYDLEPAALGRYGFVWTYEPDAAVLRALRGRCAPVYDRDGFYLCRVVRTTR